MSTPAVITKDCDAMRHSALGHHNATIKLRKGTRLQILHPASDKDGYVDSMMCITSTMFLIVVPNDCIAEEML